MFSILMLSKVKTLCMGIASKGAGVISAFFFRFYENCHSLRYPDVGGYFGFPCIGPFLGVSDVGALLLLDIGNASNMC